MLLDELVRTSEVVAATRARTAKVAALVELLRSLAPDEVEPAVGFLTGVPRQGRIGVGWRTAVSVEAVPAGEAIDEPLEARLVHLDAVAGELAVPRVLTADPGAARGALDTALARGHEGVVVKALGSSYDAGRRGGSWRKVKPVRTLDLVVLAAEWGHGRRQGWLSNLWLGARDPAGGFVMVGKTFKGLTDALLAWQTDALLARETGREGIVVHVRPELVVEVALDGVQGSTRYPGGVALRFARVRRYRDDKDPDDADVIDAVRALRVGEGGEVVP